MCADAVAPGGGNGLLGILLGGSARAANPAVGAGGVWVLFVGGTGGTRFGTGSAQVGAPMRKMIVIVSETHFTRFSCFGSNS